MGRLVSREGTVSILVESIVTSSNLNQTVDDTASQPSPPSNFRMTDVQHCIAILAFSSHDSFRRCCCCHHTL